MTLSFNFDHLQTADNGREVAYGGFVQVNDIEVQATGTDRELNLVLDVLAVAIQILQRELTDEEAELLDDKISNTENFAIDL